MGQSGTGVVAAAVVISTFGTVNALMLSAPRVYIAMASERLLFAPIARVRLGSVGLMLLGVPLYRVTRSGRDRDRSGIATSLAEE